MGFLSEYPFALVALLMCACRASRFVTDITAFRLAAASMLSASTPAAGIIAVATSIVATSSDTILPTFLFFINITSQNMFLLAF